MNPNDQRKKLGSSRSRENSKIELIDFERVMGFAQKMTRFKVNLKIRKYQLKIAITMKKGELSPSFYEN